MMFAVSIELSIILVFYVNKDFKKVMYDDLDRENLPSLVFRIF